MICAKTQARTNIFILLGFLWLAMVSKAAFCQSKENIPVPEYFGIYAVADSHLIKLDAQKVHAEKNINVRLGQRNGVGNILQGQAVASSTNAQVPELAADLKIVVFSQSGGRQTPLDTANSIHLERLVFVRNLTVNTGFPNNVRRSGAENGWESGDAPELLGMSSGDRAKSLEFLVKPMQGHQDMVVAVLPEKLSPGLYRIRVGEADPFSGGGGLVFGVSPVSDGEVANCVDALVTYSFNLSETKFAACGGKSPAGGGGSSENSKGDTSSPVQPSGSPTATAAACTDYETCMHAGESAFQSSDWSTAASDFEAAAKQRPTNGEPWAWLGKAYLGAGRTQDAPGAWDKALQMGVALTFSACHGRGIRPCETGDLYLNSKEISFTVDGEKLFSQAPSQVAVSGTSNSAIKAKASFGLQVSNKKYTFDFFPVGVSCGTGSFLHCPENGVKQQTAISDYVSRTIPKLASGTGSQPATSSGGTPSAQSNNSPCDPAVDSGYSILLQGHLYKVKTSGPAGPTQIHLFFDEKGVQVSDSSLLQPLATAAWARENVVASPDARNGSNRVSTVLGTSKALQGYSNIQDVLARGMVEALEAVVTDGASLSKAVPNLTGGVLSNQLKSAPKTVFILTAQRGLEETLAVYKRMEAVPLPPADATVLNGPDLLKIKALYIQGRTLELPYLALASKLMPVSATQLTNQAFSSVISELLPAVGLSSTEQVTLKSLLDLQKSLGNLKDTLPALQAYSQNLSLALTLANKNNYAVSAWALNATSGCGASATAAKTAEGTIDLVGTTMLGGGDMFTLIVTPPNYKPKDRQPIFAVDAATRWKCNLGDTVRISYKDPPPEANSWKGTAAELTGVVVSLVVLKPAH